MLSQDFPELCLVAEAVVVVLKCSSFGAKTEKHRDMELLRRIFGQEAEAEIFSTTSTLARCRDRLQLSVVLHGASWNPNFDKHPIPKTGSLVVRPCKRSFTADVFHSPVWKLTKPMLGLGPAPKSIS